MSMISPCLLNKIVVGVPAVLQTREFELTKFSVNDKELWDEILLSFHTKEVHDFTPESVGKTLCIKWNIHEDTLSPDKVTRPTMLSFVSSIYDPLSLIMP